MSLVVFGSINLDFVAQTPRLPLPGETLQGHRFFTVPGGKGANQAVATARLGATTYMLGRVGADQWGQELLASLQGAQVQTDGVQITPEVSSGVAIITVRGPAENIEGEKTRGENTIIVIPGANGQVTVADAEALASLLPETGALLLQLEIPMPAILAVARLAHQARVSVILDPAPAPRVLPAELYPWVDVITPNETEASQLVGLEMTDESAWKTAGQFFLQKGVKNVVIKLGGRGVFAMNQSEQFWLKPFPVKVVDTVAAGDAFNGAMAVALDRGLSFRESVTWGAAAGALATTISGAQPSLPDWKSFEQFLANAQFR
ncbi:MAG: ribokinase [Oscillatoriales cyanobacterium RM2_1_1]|nr:ribokinase [Oscillatoriales cyanobacterium SM2_3_0]NJO46863.1 ribokinase [Oscillatoriales cyanobacterium RM2_1_1]